MRSTLRTLTFGLAATLAGGLSAQYPYGINVYGIIAGCTPGQTVNIQTVQGTQPAYNFDVTVDPNNCSFMADLGVSTELAWVQVSTQCNGQVITLYDSASFTFLGDSAMMQFTMTCGGGGAYDCNGVLNGPDMPGTACDDGDPMTFNDLWTPNCVCTGSDTTAVYDCLFIPNGPNLPGTPCTTFFGTPGVWNLDCVCVGDTNNNILDCLGLLNGPNMPGTACDDNDPSTTVSWWSLDCVCTSDTGGTLYDCLQIPNGPNLPGTPSVIPGTTIEGTWSNACVCVANNTDPCQADFWVLQAYGQDSLPVPYELWVWNLSTGGNGDLSYLWSFGDGTSSTDPYPSHTYSGNGPYVLCLTITDNNSCTSTHCDSISIDGDGMYTGMIGGEGDRQDGFTINVQNPNAATAVEEMSSGDMALWPNPVADELNVALNSALRGTAIITVIDLNGRVVLNERHALNGRTQMRLATEALEPGMYTLRITDGARTVASQRFVKAN